jgi:hypothetical protein
VAPTLSRSNSLSSRKSQSVAAAASSSQHGGHHHEGERQFRVNLPDGQVDSITSRRDGLEFFFLNSFIHLLFEMTTDGHRSPEG